MPICYPSANTHGFSVSRGSSIHELVQGSWFVDIMQVKQIVARVDFPLFWQLFQHYAGQVSVPRGRAQQKGGIEYTQTRPLPPFPIHMLCCFRLQNPYPQSAAVTVYCTQCCPQWSLSPYCWTAKPFVFLRVQRSKGPKDWCLHAVCIDWIIAKRL